MSDTYYEYQTQLVQIKKDKMTAESTQYKIENGFNVGKFRSQKYESMAYIAPGGFVIITTLGIVFAIIMTAYRRNIMAFGIQQGMPVVKEGMEEIAPTMGKVVGSMAKEVAPVIKDVSKDIAPIYGEYAKEIAKGIKEGMKDEDKQE